MVETTTSAGVTSLTPELARIVQESNIKGIRSNEVRAQETADALGKELSANQVLQTAASIPDFETGALVREKNTSRKDKDGKILRDSEEDKANEQAEKALKYGEELYLKGYENMSEEGKKYVREKVAQDILNHPSYRDFFSEMNLSEAKYWSEEKARDLLRDPRYRESISKLISEQISLDKIIEDTVSGLEVEITNLSEQKQKNEERMKQLDRDIESYKKELSEYEKTLTGSGTSRTVKAGKHFERVDKLRRQAKTIEREISRLEKQKESLSDEVDEIKDDLKIKEGNFDILPLEAQTKREKSINKLKQNLSSQKRELRKVDDQIRKKRLEADEFTREADAIESRKPDLETKLKEAEKEKSELESKLNKLTTDIVQKQLDLAHKKGDRTLKMKHYIKELEGVFGKAANELLEADMTRAAGYLNKKIAEDALKATNDRDKRVGEKLATSFFEAGKWKKDNIETYKNILMTQASNQDFKNVGATHKKESLFLNGAEKALVQMMKDAGYGDAYIYEQFTKDKAFVDTQSRTVAKSIIAHRFMKGGWSKAEMQSIVESSWGKGLLAEGSQLKEQIMSEINGAYEKNSKLFKASEWMKKYGLAFLRILVVLGLLWLIFGTRSGA